mmetsp:Transcript_25447/g.50059  ORF Transcript_25447/g.50059 Transcript_25447/m.50059 type:complete len:200 (+) Transcript_25447:3098-3697(+)
MRLYSVITTAVNTKDKNMPAKTFTETKNKAAQGRFQETGCSPAPAECTARYMVSPHPRNVATCIVTSMPLPMLSKFSRPVPFQRLGINTCAVDPGKVALNSPMHSLFDDTALSVQAHIAPLKNRIPSDEAAKKQVAKTRMSKTNLGSKPRRASSKCLLRRSLDNRARGRKARNARIVLREGIATATTEKHTIMRSKTAK